MGMSIEFIVEKFLQSYSKPFTRSEFSAMMKGLRLVSSDKEANALLDSFDCIYKISDDYYNLGRILSVVDELIIISKSRYGCYSSDVKKVLERIIGYVQMNFYIRNGRMRHRFRYNNKIKL